MMTTTWIVVLLLPVTAGVLLAAALLIDFKATARTGSSSSSKQTSPNGDCTSDETVQAVPKDTARPRSLQVPDSAKRDALTPNRDTLGACKQNPYQSPNSRPTHHGTPRMTDNQTLIKAGVFAFIAVGLLIALLVVFLAFASLNPFRAPAW